MYKITDERSRYFNYCFYFPYDPNALEFCRALKREVGYNNFNYVPEKKCWGFSDARIGLRIMESYPQTELKDSIGKLTVLIESERQKELVAAQRLEKAKELKIATDSDIKLKGLKMDLYPYQMVGVEFLKNNYGRAILADTMGCISGDAEIIVNRGGGAKRIQLRKLYEKMKKWDASIPTKTRAHTADGLFRLETIVDVLYKGEKKTKIIRARGSAGEEYRLRATTDHKVATPTGWKELQKLSIGNQIIVNGDNIRYCETCKENTPHADSEYLEKYRPENYGCCKRCIYRFKRNNRLKGKHFDKAGYVYVSNVFFHPSIFGKNKKFNAVFEHILVYEAWMNDVSYEEWLDMCRYNKIPERARFIDTSTHSIHHKDGNKSNNVIGNLELFTRKEHAMKHISGSIRNLTMNLVPSVATIYAIETAKMTDVYDIQMNGPDHNFIANGIVVHNCGKTVQSLAYAVNEGFEKILVICPASVKYSWENEVKKWTYLVPRVFDSKDDEESLFDKDYNVLIVNYDILGKFLSALIAIKWKCIIMDEFHYIKNRRAQRTKYAKEIAKRVPGLLLLSGTPLLSRPEELFNGLNLLDGLTWNNWFNFTKKFCGGHFGRFGYETKGATNIEELREKISPYFLRRTKEEVLPDLPPKRYIDLPVKLDDKTREKYTIAKNNFVKYLRETKKKTNEEIMKSLFAETLVKLNELRMITSEGKIEYAKEVINNILDGGEKVVVFSVYNQPLEQLKETFGESAVLLTGNTEQKERARVIEEFQNNPNKKIFLGGIKSAGIGITLTAASNVLFCDYSWVPADHAQAMDRTHRIGQKADSITIYQLYAKDTIDHNMKNLLEKKQSIFDKIVGGDDSEIKKEHSMISDITNIMRQEYEE